MHDPSENPEISSTQGESASKGDSERAAEHAPASDAPSGPSRRLAVRIRPATDHDAAAVIDLIGRVYAEFPGCILDVDREEPRLRAPASLYAGFWVLEDSERRVLGCVGCDVREAEPPSRFVFELVKLYLDPSLRGHGLGRRLVEVVESHVRSLGLPRIELWSDTRFTTAHAVYERMGYRRTGRVRDLHDLSSSTEWHFEKEL